jgi:hypothetical protein
MWTSVWANVAFALGHLAVFGTAACIRRVWRWQAEPDLAAIRKSIDELVDLKERAQARVEELIRARAELARTELEAARAASMAAATDRPRESVGAMWAFVALAFVFLELDALIWVALSAPSQLLGMGLIGWAYLAFPISSTTVLLWHVVIMSAFHDASRPAATVRRARVAVVITGLLVVAAMTLVLAGRNISQNADLVTTLTGLGLFALGATSSLCSAFCAVVAATIHEMHRPWREQDRLDRLVHRYKRHIQLLEEGETGDAGEIPAVREPAKTAQPSPGSPARQRPSAVNALMLLAGLIATPGIAGAQTPFARAGSCEIMVDVSRSADHDARRAALNGLAGQLDVVAGALGCRVLRLATFADEPVLVLEEFALPTVSDPRSDCQAALRLKLDDKNKSVDVLYPHLADARQREALDRCIRERRPKQGEDQAARAAAINSAAARLKGLGLDDVPSPCTAVATAVLRSLRRTATMILISDGVSDCPGEKASVSVPAGALVLVVQLPQSQKRSAKRLSRVVPANVEALLPGALSVFAPEATASFWQQLKPRGFDARASN